MEDFQASGWLSDFLAQPVPKTPWLIEPYIPLGGVVFFHGPTSVGKSPFTWKLASSVTTGTDFFGFAPARTGNVLYLEFDTPGALLHPRLKSLRQPPDGHRMYLEVWPRGLNVVSPNPMDVNRLHQLQKLVDPVLVIVNTLRKAHALDDKNSETPSQVYNAFRRFFPSATLFFVHHDKKESSDPYANPDQAFSGSAAWANDAQIALHITRMAKKVKAKDPDESEDDDVEPEAHEKSRVQVKMTKSQVSDHERYPPLILQLDSDGSNWLETGPGAYRRFFKNLDLSIKRSVRIKMTMQQFDVKKTTIYSAVEGLD